MESIIRLLVEQLCPAYARRTPTPIFGQRIIHAGEVGVLLLVLAMVIVHTTFGLCIP